MDKSSFTLSEQTELKLSKLIWKSKNDHSNYSVHMEIFVSSGLNFGVAGC